MSDLIQKAKKGEQSTLTTLYSQNKSSVLNICRCLLINNEDAEAAATTVFKNLWADVTTGRVSSEEEFARLVTRRTVIQCRAKMLRKSERVFNTPANGNFANVSYDVEKMDFTGELHEVVLKNLPAYHRFIYVLHALCGYSALEIAKIFNTTEKLIGKALEAENINIDRIMLLFIRQTGTKAAINANDFHAELLDAAEKQTVSETLDAVIQSQIQFVCEPIQKQQQKKRMGIFGVAAVLLVVAGIVIGMTFSGGEDSNVDLDNADPDVSVTAGADTGEEVLDDGTEDETLAQVNATHYADIEIEGYGTITVALDGDTAPETVANFVSLAEEGFYDGLTFHRIMDGFMMQGGDPNGDSTGGNTDADGNEVNITGEFADNGFENNISHTRGTISMARSDDYNSASSQFFIVHEDSDFLDGQYAAFGHVTEGMDIVDTICTSAEPTDDNGTIPTEDQPVITSITIRDAEAISDDTAEANLDEVA